eukprot:Gb_04945 [translate_table: standard]
MEHLFNMLIRMLQVGETLVEIILDGTHGDKVGFGVVVSPIETESQESFSQLGESPLSIENREKVLSTPVVRNLAKEYGVRLEDIPGTGKDGRVLKEDVLQYVTNKESLNDELSATSQATQIQEVDVMNVGSTRQDAAHLKAAAGQVPEDKIIPLRLATVSKIFLIKGKVGTLNGPKLVESLNSSFLVYQEKINMGGDEGVIAKVAINHLPIFTREENAINPPLSKLVPIKSWQPVPFCFGEDLFLGMRPVEEGYNLSNSMSLSVGYTSSCISLPHPSLRWLVTDAEPETFLPMTLQWLRGWDVCVPLVAPMEPIVVPKSTAVFIVVHDTVVGSQRVPLEEDEIGEIVTVSWCWNKNQMPPAKKEYVWMVTKSIPFFKFAVIVDEEVELDPNDVLLVECIRPSEADL